MKELPKVYEPQQVESSIYEMWMENDCFKATPDPDKKPYSIVMPPPNVTGQLHMGHALDATLQDILTRYKRMQGYSALWLPGTRGHRHADQGRRRAPRQRRQDPVRSRPREVPRARLGVERKIRKPHRPAAEKARRELRLVEKPLYDGRGLLKGRARGILRDV